MVFTKRTFKFQNRKIVMINLILENELNYLGTSYNLLQINENNYKLYYKEIEQSINNFNKEIKWDGMFDLNIAIERFKNGMTMYIGLIDDFIFGHAWFKDYKKGKCLFNLFVVNKIDIKKHSGKEFVSNILYEYYPKTIIYSEVDDWNIKSIRLLKRLGFKIN